MALIIALVSYAVVLGVYISYVAFILRNKKTKEYLRLIDQLIAKPFVREDLPNVTAIIPVYNEEAVISQKLQNLAELDYPMEKIEVLLVDDSSTDNTSEFAENMIRELRLNGKIVRNSRRMGANACYNIGATNASSDLILRTDADVTIKPDTLRKAVQIISNIENVGGVTAKMVPMIDTAATTATTVEKTYRDLFDQMSIAESALYATFPGGGGFTLMRKSVFSPISIDQGSTDGNISLSMIRKGFRHIYVPQIFCQETISHQLGEQMKQKARRARRLIQSTVASSDFLFNKKYREFGLIIYPLRFSMFVICPFLIFGALLSTFYLLFSYSLFLAVSMGLGAFLVLYAGIKTKVSILNSFTSVFAQQFYLLLGLFLLPKRNSTWKSARTQRTK